jgi:hypothetical protein
MIEFKALGGATKVSPRRDSAGTFQSANIIMMRVSPRAFLLGKAMRIKSVEGLEACITKDGKIALKQDSLEYGKTVVIYLTLQQFDSLESWVFKNKDEIESTWNGGAEDD